MQEKLLSVARKVLPNQGEKQQHGKSERKLTYAYGQNGHIYNYNMPVNDDTERFLDLTDYALKYVGCQNIHTWSDNRAAGENGEYESPLSMEKFVVLRLCEREQCSAYNKWGCNYEYAECKSKGD